MPTPSIAIRRVPIRRVVLRRVVLRRVALCPIVLLLAAWLVFTSPAYGQAAVSYQPPVSGPVVDGWRPPPGPYGAGNRGIDYGTEPGQPVGSTATGVVSFAGSVAGTRWVVVRHGDGRRSSLGPLSAVLVASGATVSAGQQVGTALGPVIHWGVREADVYIDPSTLLPPPTSGRGRLRLTG